MSEYKKIHAELLKIYKEIKQLCDKNNIRCFAVGGTMLGAVRHNGFIPWDDDMDLGIPVDDFDKFRKACKKELREPYEFKDLLWIGGKVHNKQTSFIETPCAINRENGYGIFVDIFPIIGTPNSSEERLDFLNNMLLYSFQAMIFDRYPDISKYTKQQLIEWRRDLLYKHKVADSERVAEFSFGHSFTNDSKGLSDPIELRFEDTTILVPSTYDADLTAHYGNYMELPPKDERHSHNNFALVSFNESYENYYKRLEKLDPEFLTFLRRKHNLEGEFFLNSALFMSAESISKRELAKANKELELIKQSMAYKISSKLRKFFQ